MPLIDRNKVPPGGFQFYEPSLKWRAPNPLLPIEFVAEQLQIVRVQNPFSGLNPTLNACLKAIDDAACERLGNDPAWCVSDQMAPAVIQYRASSCCGAK